MYQPPSFRVDDLSTQHDFMDTHPFGLIVAMTESGFDANHIPLVLDRARGPLGTLRGHVARGNALASYAASAPSVLVVFQGPEGYISPDWYESEKDQVPTWNYAVIHATGVLRPTAPESLPVLLADLTRVHEEKLRPKKPWTLDKMSEPGLAALLRAISGFEIEITRIEAKFKLSQNRKDADFAGAVAGLRARPVDAARDLAGLMETARAARKVTA